jgi:hypothetical protein
MCQGGNWRYCSGLRYGGPFYGDSNSKHNYDLLGMKAVLQFSMRRISRDFGFMNEQEDDLRASHTEMLKILNSRKRLTVNLPRNTAVYCENSGN